MKYTYTLITIVLFTALVSCKPKIEAPEASMGEVDASRYIAIGTNNTSGYSNDGLTLSLYSGFTKSITERPMTSLSLSNPKTLKPRLLINTIFPSL